MPILKWFPPQGSPRTFVLYKPVSTIGRALGLEEEAEELVEQTEEAYAAAAAEHPEFDAWRWGPLSDACDLIVPFKREAYEAVVSTFSALLI